MPSLNVNDILALLQQATESGVTISFEDDNLLLNIPDDREIDPSFLTKLRQHKVHLVEYLKQQDAEEEYTNVITPLAGIFDGHVPLSFSQERLWFIDQLQGSVQYHMKGAFRISGRLDTASLERTFQAIVNRHEILRTVILQEEGRPYQHVLEKDRWHMGFTDDERYHDDAVQLQAYIITLFNIPFDLARDHTFRAHLIKLSADEHMLVIVLHHIAADGWSMAVLFDELQKLYGIYAGGHTDTLPPPAIQYADYALWQRKYQQGIFLDRQLAHWRKKLAGTTLLELPTDGDRGILKSTRGAMITFMIDEALTGRVRQLSRDRNATLYMTLLAAFKVLLYRYSGVEDVCVGGAIAGRTQMEVEELIGFFVNTLALRTDLSGNPTFSTVLDRVRSTMLDVYEHQDAPFEKVVEMMGGERDISKNPLFQVIFVLDNEPPMPALTLGEATVTREPVKHITSQFDQFWSLLEKPEGIQVELEYCVDLFSEDTMQRMVTHYLQLLRSVVDNPAAAIGSFDMLPAAEKEKVIHTFNHTAVSYPAGQSITALFDLQAQKTPAAIALSFGSEQLTYKMLEERTNQLAQYLKTLGVRPGMFVPVCLDRSTALIVSILGILKAGGVYVPIDPEYPKERIRFMLEDTGASRILTSRDYQTLLLEAAPDAALLCIDQVASVLETLPAIPVQVPLSADAVAYVMYTSGSTGKPKGTLVTHRNVVSLATGGDFVPLGPDSVLLSTGSPSFDATTIEYWGMLLNGGQLVMCPQHLFLDNRLLREEIRNRKVNIMWFTASWFNQLVDDDIHLFEGLSVVMVGGEKLSEDHIRRFRAAWPQTTVINGYGPTENTTFSLTYPIDTIVRGRSIPIGRPLGNRTAYVLDAWGQPAPIGVAGELYVGGAGVSAGYLHQPELTAEKFVPDPFSREPGARLYRTGDRARWLSDGTVEYLGRIDDQVKIRGYRIEPGEIEKVLNALEQVAAGAVVVKQQTPGEKRLVGYYVPDLQEVRRKEAELCLQQVETWKELYETAYTKAEEIPDLDEEFNITGWNDSFTGEAIPPELMAQWLQDITGVILAESPKRVLEIGSGTGLIYYQLAGHIDRYIGTDFSSVSMAQMQRRIDKKERVYPETTLKLCAAHDVTIDDTETIDTIILNSIIQYFPGEQYMTDVLAKCMSLLKGNGTIIIGDVRDLRLLPAFKRRLQLGALQDKTLIRDFNWQVEQEVLKEEELCFSPAYFYQLATVFPGITHVSIQWKDADYSNELSLYRYTVILHVGREKNVLRTGWQSWDTLDDKKSVQLELLEGKELIALKDVPNPRLWKERLQDQALRSKAVDTVRELAAFSTQPDPDTVIVQDFIRLAKNKGYHIRLLLNDDPLKVDLILGLHPFDGIIERPAAGNVATAVPKTSIPLFADICALIQRDIRDTMARLLPEYMIPGDFVALQQLPLTNNGKTDRRFLCEREDMQRKSTINYQAPVTATELQLAAVWADLLRVDAIGVKDNFFESGGHSLLATRAVSAIRKALGAELTVRDFFLYPTIGQLAAYLDQQDKSSLLPPVLTGRRPLQIPLSFSQERLWFIDELEGSLAYHMPVALRLKGALNKAALTKALQALVNRHEVLRTVIREKNGTAYQQVMDKNRWEMNVSQWDFRLTATTTLHEHILSVINQPFNLSEDHMLRAHLMEGAHEEYILVVVMHHIASDGWSVSILVNELAAFYEAFSDDSPAALAELDLQYADFAVWQRNWLTPDVLDARMGYWKQQLENVAPLNLPTDRTRPAVQRRRGSLVSFKIDHILREQLKQLAQQEDATLFMTLLAAFKVLLHRYSGQEDICVGSPVAGRIQQEVEGLIGFFVNTLALRSDLGNNPTFTALLQQVKETTLAAYDHQEIPFEKIVDAVVTSRDLSRTPLFQVVFGLQNMPDIPAVSLGSVSIQEEVIEHTTAQFDLSFSAIENRHGIDVDVEYCTDLFDRQTIVRLWQHFEQLLRSVVLTPDEKIGSLPMLARGEREQLLEAFNGAAVGYPKEKTIVDLLMEQALRTPDAVAVSLENDTLTYRELHERSNRLAHHLREKGVQEDTLVPICIERSPDMIVGILAILKAGGAYVPIDPDYPEERIRFMLEDTAATVIVTSSSCKDKLKTNRKDIVLVAVDKKLRTPAAYKTAPPVTQLQPANLAYVIYTSGSTGNPKGVLIEHRNVVRLFETDAPLYDFNGTDVWTMFHSFCFDFSVWEMYGALFYGGRLVIVPKPVAQDAIAFGELLLREKVTILNQTPSAFYVLQDYLTGAADTVPVRYVIFGGEALNPGKVQPWLQTYPNCRLVNMYGITETTVHVTYQPIGLHHAESSSVIGVPIPTLSLYILDPYGGLVPAGVAGELHVGGAGLARGYLHRPELTETRFVADPFSKTAGARMYRTGDLGRWLPDGSLEYLGRIDDQVKIRGFRIELGEIESVMTKCELVSQAVVLAKADNKGNKRLVGYVVPNGTYDKAAILAFLKDRLPDYMVPAILVELDKLPLTRNGKVDKKALPDADAGATLTNEYVAPRTETERALALIWKDLLGVERIGIYDNFFELGGDSIITIQVVSRARRAGYHLHPRDLFLHQTIGSLAAVAGAGQESAHTGEQGQLTGDSGLLPIQHWYFDSKAPTVSHYNQGLQIAVDKSITPEAVATAIAALVRYHDALRFTYKQNTAGWTQSYGYAEGELEVADLRAIAPAALQEQVLSYANAAHTGLDITAGRLLHATLLLTPSATAHNQLLLAVHHLSIDGVSWRIILEDLELLLKNKDNKTAEEILGAKSASVRQWQHALVSYGHQVQLTSQPAYWEKIASRYQPLKKQRSETKHITMKDLHQLQVRLDASKTTALLQDVPGAYHTEINDVLLCALTQTLTTWNDGQQVVIGLEGHGREDIAKGIDTSRTVGWFTSLYPVLPEVAGLAETGDILKSIKEQLRQVPDKGIGFGVLKYLNKIPALQGSHPWDIVFNYLGQADRLVNEAGPVRHAQELPGQGMAPDYPVHEKIAVNGVIQNGELILDWSYSALHFDAADIAALAALYLTRLEDLIAHCVSKQKTVFTPSDFGLGGVVSIAELDAFMAADFRGVPRQGQVEGIYRLSGLQEGMLFHGLYDKNNAAYIEQLGCDLDDPDIAVLQQSWNHLLNRYSVLRTGFYYDEFSVPLQCAYQHAEMPFELLDYRHLDPSAQQQALKDYEAADLQRGIDFREAPLMRITLVRLQDKRYRMLWTFHHILFDGWSLAVIIENLLRTYENLSAGQLEGLYEKDHYSDYIHYVERLDKGQAAAYWQGYLKDTDEGTLLPFIPAAAERTKGAGIYKSVAVLLDKDNAAALTHFAQQQRITVNTVMQGVWAYLLSRYTGRSEVTYGVTVSGRPEDLSGVEQRVGLYINTLPLHTVVQENSRVVAWLQEIQASQLESREFQYTGLDTIQRGAGIAGDLFDSLLVFENYPVGKALGASHWRLRIDNASVHEHTNYPLDIIVEAGEEISIRFNYNSDLLLPDYMKAMAAHFEQVLLQVMSSGNILVRELEWLTSEEYQQLHTFNDTAESYPAGNTLVSLFTEQASRTPALTAVVFENETLTYRQLDERSAQLAGYLREKGVGGETLVPVLLERSINMIVAILGVLRAGGAYVPIDPGYPEERVHYMLKDTHATVVLGDSRTAALVPVGVTVVKLDTDWPLINAYAVKAPEVAIAPENLAYVIYTSGSTGTPKGVMNEHKGVVNRLLWAQDYFGLLPEDAVLQKTTFSFDVSVWELFWPLTTGARLVFAKPEGQKDADYLQEAIRRYGITTIHFVPSLLNVFLENIDSGACPSLQRVLCSGEALKPQQVMAVRDKLPHVDLYNLYGPTEAAIEVTCWHAPATPGHIDIVPIGKPVANTQLHIVDKTGHLLPPGIAGELHIGGIQVARGYLNRSDLTAEKFVVDLFSHTAGATMYRTGDLCRWLPDGNIEYLGRIDDQVKIRGFRVEPGEIENALLDTQLVNDAAVVAKEDANGHKRLVAYVVPAAAFDKEAIVAALRERLPEYMVPAITIPLEAIPLTASGKTNRKALPDPDFTAVATGAHAAPRNETERILADIWQQLLNLPRIGIYDNFFESGGDSIITIQVVSRARRAGLEFQPRDIFTYQHIAALAAELQSRSKSVLTGEQGLLTGDSGLLPIQQWYLETAGPDAPYFNQSLLLTVSKQVDTDTLAAAVQQLLATHDSLRFRYRYDGKEWTQTYGNYSGMLAVEDLQETPAGQLASRMEQLGDHYHASLSLENGILIRTVFIRTPATEANNRLLVVVHHLAVDGVSWRILLEDLELLLTEGPGALTMPKGTSYRQWQQALASYGQSGRLQTQLPFWEQTAQHYHPLPADTNNGDYITASDIRTMEVRLNAGLTQQLLQRTSQAYRTEVNDLLLAALTRTLSSWSGTAGTVIGLEGHGREDIAAGTDTSRTVGWCTSLYPVFLPAAADAGPAALLKSVKESLRKVTDKGIGYGVLRYINKAASLQGTHPWDIIFNYLGQVDNLMQPGSYLGLTNESTGAGMSPVLRVHEKMGVDCIVQDGELVVQWKYSRLHYKAATITQLTADYLSQLETLILHCVAQQETNVTPADYGLGQEISWEELDRFLDAPYKGVSRRRQVSGLYRLSGLQEGMLFHSLYDGEGGTYIEQFVCDLEQLHPHAFIQSWNRLLQQYTILRTGFYYDEFTIPVQCVYEQVEIPVTIFDYTHLDKTAQEEAFAGFKAEDLRQGFDFREAPLTRLALVRLQDNNYRMLWTSHHMLLDGWSLPVLVDSLLNTYELLVTGKELPAVTVDHFEDYIRYQEKQDKAQLEDFWSRYLQGATEGTLLPFIDAAVTRTKGSGVYLEHLLTLDIAFTQQLTAFTQQHHITTSTLMEGVWAYLLHRYTSRDEISYGVTVSGRPDDLPGVEQRVGLYINTLPLHTQVDGQQQIVSWLQAIQAEQLKSRDFQYASLNDVQRWTGVNGDLFDSSLTFQNYPVNEVLEARDWALKIRNVEIHPHTNYPLTIIIGIASETTLLFAYNSDLLPTHAVRMMAGHFRQTLEQIITHQAAILADIEPLTPAEKTQLLQASAVDYPQDATVVSLLEAQATRAEQETAVVFEGDSLTWRQLEDQSNQLARYLRNLGVQPGELVPLCIERSVQLIVGLLGILKAGAAYVPVDPEFPAERIEYMLKDTGARIVVSSNACMDLLPQRASLQVIAVDGNAAKFSILAASRLQMAITPDSVAYVIYTSGSTGQPKGVQVTHRNLVDYTYGLKAVTPLEDCRTFGLLSSIATDLGNTVIFGSLLTGGALHLFSKDTVNDPEKINRYLRRHPLDVIKIVPSHWKALCSGDEMVLPQRLLIFGGEALDSSVIDSLREAKATCTVVNHYGPTETTIGKLLHVVSPEREYGKTVPIGKPFSNTNVCIVSPAGKLCPAGVPGELLIGGAGVAKGYLHQPALTAHKFITNPFHPDAGQRVYRTGDLVKYLPDGNILFLGRIDDQVKIRGYRVEPGEIAAVIAAAESVRQAVVLVKTDASGEKRLVAYVVPDGEFDREGVTVYVRQELPDYMHPSAMLVLDQFPLLPNGKIDRRALPDPEVTLTTGDEYTAPSTPTETRMVAIWSRLLEVEQVGLQDDFFALGGHSLLAIRLISAIRKELTAEVVIGDVFDYPTVKALSARLDHNRIDTTVPAIVKQNRPKQVPLSFGQERFWFIDQMEGSVHYHVPAVLRLKGSLQPAVLENALQTIVDRHEVLRTVMEQEDGQAYQQVKPAGNWRLNRISRPDYQHNMAALHEEISRLVAEPFDLQHDYMLRVHLIRLSEQEHVMVVILHHIASDGWSNTILVNELMELYAASVEGRMPQLKTLPVQYADYAIWQRSYLSGDVLEQQLGYWKGQLTDVAPLQLPTDFIRPAVQSTRGARYWFMIDADLTSKLRSLCHEEGVTLFMTLLAAYNVLLHRYSGQDDICVGSPVAGRTQHESEGLIGLFINTIALRADLSDNPVFTTFLQQVKTTTLGAFAHQEVPFEKIVDAVVKDRDVSRTPLFQAAFVLQNAPEVPELKLRDVAFAIEDIPYTSSKVDLNFTMEEVGGALRGCVEYCADLFHEDTVRRMARHYEQLLQAAVDTPDASIGAMVLLSEAEKTTLLHTFNATAVDYPLNNTIIDQLKLQVDLQPEAAALIFTDQRLTYRELDERAAQMAHYLRSKGVTNRSLVPVCLERSLEMIISILGILKAGAAYVPIDPDYPADRISYMLSDTGAEVMVSSNSCSGKLRTANPDATIVLVDEEADAISRYPVSAPARPPRPEDLAYVIYTSGSTGKPKGVMLEHRGVVNLALSQRDALWLKPGMRSLQFASFGFDASCYEIFNTLLSGGILVLPRKEDLLSADSFAELVQTQQIDLVTLPPSYQHIIKDVLGPVKTIVSAGEPLNREDGKYLQGRGIRLINAYGPTENTVCTTLTDQPIREDNVVTIGKPVANVEVYILDRYGALCPIGVAGEMCIGGAGLARGYLHRETLTSEKFIPHPFSTTPGARLYRTGDTARWLPDGNIEYIGRIDHQVKIRGFRIELGEIESVLQECELVGEAVVLARADGADNKRLVGYIVPQGTFDKEGILGYLKEKLPEYMVPALLVPMEQLPVTASGKIDRRALPDPDALHKGTFVAPRDTMEADLAAIWQELLEVPQVGIYDDFFELGGDSLLAVRVVAHLKRKLSVHLSVSKLFECKDIARLAAYIQALATTAENDTAYDVHEL
ncbi:Methyltransferase domain-containing protein [Chitinophaga eiseniae]|uniref:Methyltransferase domain-containing protein n=1 Tax=Chitinophaga eiseniae TaxID=634771 RepID=A0A1T4TBX9_9BACT|nr:non-ribosomal peptide synthetase [Chitinophaga eiseniae]SKA37897.1 Methyltransferase domain-containing protein [Chitinophaga eiseniae]